MENHLLTLLKRTPPLGDLPAAQLARLTATTTERRYVRGDAVLEKGTRLTGLHVVLSGKLKEFCRAPGGEEKVIEILGAGQTCGEAALFLDTPYPFWASALTNAVLLHIEKPAIDRLADISPEFVIRMLRVLAERQDTSLRDIEAYSRSSLLQRLVGYLLEQCRASGEETPSITLPAMKQVVASRLNMTPEALSRTFRDLADAGLIEMRGKRVILLDPERLREFTRQY